MNGHCRRGGDKGTLGRHRQGHPDGVPAPQHQGNRGLGHAGNQLRNAQPRLDIAPHGVQQHQQAVHLVALLQSGQQGHDVFIFRGLGVGRQELVPLNLAHDGQGVNGPPLGLDGGRAHVHQLPRTSTRVLPAALLVRSCLVHTAPPCFFGPSLPLFRNLIPFAFGTGLSLWPK